MGLSLKKDSIGFWATTAGVPLGISGILISIFGWDKISGFIISIHWPTNIILLSIIIILVVFVVILLNRIKKIKEPRTKIISDLEAYKKSNLGKEFLQSIKDVSSVKKASKSMHELVRREKTMVLEPDIYYLYLFSLFEGAKQKIWAVSVMGDEEWVDTKEEKEFQRLNLAATKKSVRVERIFVVDDNSRKTLKTTEPVLEQIRNRSSYLKTFIVHRDKIPKSLLTSIGCGFLAFDNYAIAEDVFDGDYIRGNLFINEKTINRYDRIFNELRDYSQPLDLDLLKTF